MNMRKRMRRILFAIDTKTANRRNKKLMDLCFAFLILGIAIGTVMTGILLTLSMNNI